MIKLWKISNNKIKMSNFEKIKDKAAKKGKKSGKMNLGSLKTEKKINKHTTLSKKMTKLYVER